MFNSRSASIGETVIALKIQECEEAGLSFEEVVEQVEAYIDGQVTWFVLENLDTLRKNGRLSNLKGHGGLRAEDQTCDGFHAGGKYRPAGSGRGINKALMKMVSHITQTVEHSEKKILAISHCNCRDRALMVRDRLLEKMRVKDVFVVDTAGISTMYANDGGIIVVI